MFIESAQVPGSEGELRLYQRESHFSIWIAGHGELMNTHVYGSEDALAERTCAMRSERAEPRLLIGGLGMVYSGCRTQTADSCQWRLLKQYFENLVIPAHVGIQECRYHQAFWISACAVMMLVFGLSVVVAT